MASLAKDGKGNYAFIQNPDDALSAFAKELGGLLSTYAQNIEVEVKATNGHIIREVVSDVDVTGDDKSANISLPEILSEEERNLVLAVTLSEQSKALPRKLSPFSVSVSYDLLGKDGEVSKENITTKAKISFVKPGKEQDQPTKEVDEVVALAEMVKTQIEAEKLAKKGDYDGAVRISETVAKRLRKRGRTGQADALTKIGGKMGNAQVYSASGSYLKSAQSYMTRSVGTSSLSYEASVDIADMGVMSLDSTPAQKDLISSFTKEDPQIDTPSSPPEDKNNSVTKSSSVSKKRSSRW